MQIVIKRHFGVLTVARRVDATNGAEFERALRGVAGDDRAVIADLGKLSYISSAGLKAFLVTAKHLSNRGARFALCSLSGPVRQVFEVSGFDRIIAVKESLDDAVAFVRG